MKNLLLTLALIFSFNATSQIAVMTAVDLKDGAEDDYLKLEKFYSAVHKEAIKQGFRTGWSLWKAPDNPDNPSAAEYILFDNYTLEQYEAAQNGNVPNGLDIAKEIYKGKMSRRAIEKMAGSWQDTSNERRSYVLKLVDATILAGGDIKPGDQVSINFMSKKTDDFENYETKVWKPVAEKNILMGNLRQWALVEAIGRSENAYDNWSHLVFNLRAANPGEGYSPSGFKWEKLWEGIESSRDMSDPTTLTCVMVVQ
jgi:hypothetical protein